VKIPGAAQSCGHADRELPRLRGLRSFLVPSLPNKPAKNIFFTIVLLSFSWGSCIPREDKDRPSQLDRMVIYKPREPCEGGECSSE
jgi:hypothetical protein